VVRRGVAGGHHAVSGPPSGELIRVARIIARMNVGGPAYHVSLLSGRLDPARFETQLLTGALGAGEGSFEHLAEHYGTRIHRVAGLRPEVSPIDDLTALRAIGRALRGFRPHVVHTHTAKAGTLGRLAALLALRPRPVIVHTYHGHVLSGYFGPRKTRFFLEVERALARGTDRLLGVSQATVDDLVQLGVAPAERFSVVPIGLDLDRFLALDSDAGARLRARTRSELAVGDDEVLAISAGRLVPIKRVDVLLDAVAHARSLGAPVVVAIAGDGELRDELERTARDLGIEGATRFLGFRHDLDALVAAADIAALSSDNEGTPVALIEASAGGRPAVATDVGGVRDIVTPDTGLLAPPGDAGALGSAIAALAGSPERRKLLGAAAREHVRERWSAARLVRDIERLYDELLAEQAGGR
jgi:glycosyltransferase involved in cell wall biosynthesis